MLLIISIILVTLSLCLIFYVLLRPGLSTIDKKTVYFKRLVWVWPWVNSISVLIMPLLTWKYKKSIEQRIEYAGFKGYIDIRDIVGLQGLGAGLMPVVLIFSVVPFIDGVVYKGLALLLGVIVGWILPLYFLNKKTHLRQRAILKSFPFFLDMTTLCVESGLNFHSALIMAAQAIPDGALRFELRHALSDMRAGMNRIDALRNMATRTNLREIKQWVASIAQVESLGASLGASLRAQSEQCRVERFQHAEKMAQKAPIKLLFPLVFFILPCTFIVILYPLLGRIAVFGFY